MSKELDWLKKVQANEKEKKWAKAIYISKMLLNMLRTRSLNKS